MPARHTPSRLKLKDENRINDLPASILNGQWVIAREFGDGRRYWAGPDSDQGHNYWVTDPERAACFTDSADAHKTLNRVRGVNTLGSWAMSLPALPAGTTHLITVNGLAAERFTDDDD